MRAPDPASIFRRSLPLLGASFVNKCGSIGLTLLPVLLVERGISPSASGLLLGWVKTAGMAGIFFGGAATDWFGLRKTVLAAFFFIGLGLCGAALAPSLVLIGVFAFLGNFGEAMFPSAARLMLFRWVPREGHRESIGWLRMANNLGQVFAYGIGAAFSAVGVTGFMLWDGFTGLLAWAIGYRKLPELGARPEETAGAGTASRTSGWLSPREAWPLAGAAIHNSLFALTYELFWIVAPALIERAMPGRGLGMFSKLMIVNTVICALAAVPMARVRIPLNVMFALGWIFTGAAGALLLSAMPLNGTDTFKLFLSAFLATLGELFFMALANFSLMRLVPEHRHQGKLYGGVMVFNQAGRVVAGALAFPAIVYGTHGMAVWAVLVIMGTVAWMAMSRVFRKIG